MAVARAVRELGAPAGVKWPNDVVLDGRKLGGILAETSVANLVALGIGLNVCNPPPEDPRLAARSTRLVDAVPGIGVEDVLEPLLRHLSAFWQMLLAPDLAPLRGAWSELDTTSGRRLHWSEGDARGLAEGVDADGALRIRTDDGRLVAVQVGEVVFLNE
jgi:BirA family biotin operon repressor/biotin-[acetyl-CoA-carboxylase] ligase